MEKITLCRGEKCRRKARPRRRDSSVASMAANHHGSHPCSCQSGLLSSLGCFCGDSSPDTSWAGSCQSGSNSLGSGSSGMAHLHVTFYFNHATPYKSSQGSTVHYFNIKNPARRTRTRCVSPRRSGWFAAFAVASLFPANRWYSAWSYQILHTPPASREGFEIDGLSGCAGDGRHDRGLVVIGGRGSSDGCRRTDRVTRI